MKTLKNSLIRNPDKSALLAEKIKRDKAIAESKPLDLGTDFPQQNAFVDETSRFIAAQCTRRAGKSNALALKFFRTMEKYPGSGCLYIALTRESAYNIMWPALLEHNERHNIGCKFIESRLTVEHPNGAKLRLVGADAKNFIRRLKGIKSPGVAIDEAQDFGVHIQSLVDDVLTPVIADYKDGWIALTGTPGPVPAGYFFEVTHERKYGYSVHKWTVYDNPHMPDAKAFVEDLKKKRQWDDNHPTLLREWYNQWVLDVQSLWIRYQSQLNHYITLPTLPTPRDTFNYIMGVDIGYKDADAIAVLAWSEHTKTTYLVEEIVTPKQDITELANQIKAIQSKYNVSKTVMDAGALGKKIHEELTRRHQIPIEAADKTRKQENVELLNDALRLGNFKAKETSRFAADSYLVQVDWDKSTPDKIVVKKYPHSDIIDAVLYAFKVSPAYTYVKPTEVAKYGSKEWARAQEKEMFSRTLEKMQEEQAFNDYQNNLGWGNNND
jgi:hypothetical protein